MMANKNDVLGSFGSLELTLGGSLKPNFPKALRRRWLAVVGHGAIIGRRTSEIVALPDGSDQYAAVVEALDDAAREIVVAKTNAKRETALAATDDAFEKVEQLFVDLAEGKPK